MKLKLLAAVLLIIGSVSCKKAVEEPTPAEAISGVYEAKTYNGVVIPLMTYPINGQTITLRILPVSKDTVRVEVNSTSNGFYSPGAATIYPKVFVKESNCNTCQYTRIYTIALAPPVNQGTSENSIWFDPKNNAYYTFIPPNYTTGAVQTVFVKTE